MAISGFLRSVFALLRKRLWIAPLAAVVVFGGWYFFVHSRAPKLETLTVHPKEFLQQVSVSGKVVAAHDVDLGFPQSGRVARVYVKVGDIAAQGRLLAEIENGDLRAAVAQRQAALETQQAKLLSLRQGTRPEQLAVTQSQVDSSRAALSQADQAVVDAVRNAYSVSDTAVHNKVDQFFSNARTNPQLTPNINDSQLKVTLESDRLSIEALLSGWKSMAEGLTATGDIATAVSASQQNLTAVLGFLGEANSALNRAITGQTMTQATIDGYLTDIATSRTNINNAISSLTTAYTAQKNASAALETAKKNLALGAAGSTAADIDAQAAQVKAAQADVQSAQAQLQKTMITAPFRGVITAVQAKAGANVSSNGSEVSMIDAGALQIESYIPEISVSLLSVQDPADVTLDAYGAEAVFPAVVVSLDPAETVRDGVSTYRAVLQFTQNDARIRSGMTANVVITTERKQNVLSVPQGVVAEKNGGKSVPVLAGGTVEMRTVTTGTVSSDGNIEILSGLQDGDAVVLSQP